MSTQINTRPPIISNSMAITALMIHIAICAITIKFDAVKNNGYLNQSFISDTFALIFTPITVALIITPIVVLARHSTFWKEFRTLLFVAIGGDIFLTLWQMTGFNG